MSHMSEIDRQMQTGEADPRPEVEALKAEFNGTWRSHPLNKKAQELKENFVLHHNMDAAATVMHLQNHAAERERLLAEIDRLRENLDAEREKTWILTNAIADHFKAHMERWDGDEISAENHSTDADKRLWSVKK